MAEETADLARAQVKGIGGLQDPGPKGPVPRLRCQRRSIDGGQQHSTGQLRHQRFGLRALDGLQTADRETIATPANWTPGGDVVVPLSVSDEDAIAKYGSIDKKLPYLRMAKLPG